MSITYRIALEIPGYWRSLVQGAEAGAGIAGPNEGSPLSNGWAQRSHHSFDPSWEGRARAAPARSRARPSRPAPVG
jgi:hypothetical protein